MIQVIVNDKKRIIRNKFIYYQTENDLECTYKNHRICIAKQEIGDFYISVTDKTGMYAVHGGYGGPYCRNGIETIEDCLKLAILNII